MTGTVKNVRPGDTVVIRGSQKSNGDVAAESITLGGGGFAGFGGGGTQLWLWKQRGRHRLRRRLRRLRMIRFTAPVAAAAMLALLPAAATAATPVQGSVFGPIVSVQGTTFTLTTSLSPSGKSTVTVGKATITEQGTAPKSSLKVGACVAATGARGKNGVVAATRITITEPVKGQCGAGFGGGRGSGPPRTGTVPRTGTTPSPPGGFGGGANFGFAFGSVTKVSGSTITVKGRSFGSTKATTTTVTVSAKTSLDQTLTVNASAIKVKMCAFVRGTSPDKGLTVKATNIALTPETNGKCASGFRRPGA